MYRIGVDIGGTNIAVGIVDESVKIIARASTPTKVGRDFDLIIEDMGKLIINILKENNISLDNVASIGIGAPGVLDNKSGTVCDIANIHWMNYPIREKLQKYVDLPVFMGNDANVAAWAEYLNGCGKGSENFVLLTLGTGVGGGIIINGKLYAGSHNVAAEIGHTFLKAGGEQCGCGNKGCLETYCSATALIRDARRAVKNYPASSIAGAEVISAKTVLDAAANGDELGVKLFENYVHDLSMAVASVVNFLDPEIVALGGGVANAGEFLLEPVRKEFVKYIAFPTLCKTKVLQAQMGNDAGIIGAALLN